MRSRLLRALAMLPVCVLGGGFLGGLVAYAPNSEDPESPSGLVTVMARWEDGGQPLCRAFMYRELLPHLDTLQVRFALGAAELEACRADFAAYDSREGWPRKLLEDELAYPDYWFEVEGSEPLRLMVHRSSGDANWAKTRYTVSADGAISDLETETASAGQGIGVVLGGFLGLVLWGLWGVSRLFSRLRQGRQRNLGSANGGVVEPRLLQ